MGSPKCVHAVWGITMLYANRKEEDPVGAGEHIFVEILQRGDLG